MLLDADECQLVLVDYQTRLMPAIADGTQVLANAVRQRAGAGRGPGREPRQRLFQDGLQRLRR